jgi:hypothetical protein
MNMQEKIKPLSPEEVEVGIHKSIPDFVISAVNTLLIRNVRNGLGTIKQCDIITESKKLMPENTTWDMKWLDFESLYRTVGWSVNYDGPGYNESYEPTFDFKKK